MATRIILLIVLFAVKTTSSVAQERQALIGINNIITSADTFSTRMPYEKLFLHIDRPNYTNIDTIWLKAYVLDSELGFTKQSGLLYAELVNDTGRVVMQQAIPVFTGLSWGQLALDSNVIAEGNYTLRAYTNWMQNIGGESFFTRQLYITKASDKNWLVKAGTKITSDSASTTLQVIDQQGKPVRLWDTRLKIMEGKKTWLRQTVKTDIDGRIDINFAIPKKADAARLTYIFENAHKNEESRRMVIPVPLSRPGHTDVQFMPEGGQLVAGLPSKIGFKAIGEDGNGVTVNGVLADSKKQQVASFQSLHRGMGSFELTPVAGEMYTATVTLPNGSVKNYSFPAVKTEGLVLGLSSNTTDNIINVSMKASTAAAGSNIYLLMGQSGTKICYVSVVRFTNGSTVINGRIDKNKFPSGIARFTLFTPAMQPIAERMFFVDHKDQLKISVNTGDKTYRPTDSVNVNIKVADKDDNPVEGSFSLAVTDAAQVNADSTNVPDINAYMLLSSGIKGNIEEPGYYFANGDERAYTALDNLLLTQGWVGYSWQKVFDKKAKQPAYKAEKGMEVTGSVVRLSKPLPNMPVILISTKEPVFVRDTITDQFGKFTFDNLPQFDTTSFIIEAKDKKGKIFSAIVKVDEFTPANTLNLPVPVTTPWYVNSNTTALNYNKQNMAYQKLMDSLLLRKLGNTLKEVVITAKKTIKGSFNLNGSGNADQVLDETDIKKAGNITLLDLLNLRIKGFSQYKMYGKKIKFIIDGTNLDFYYEPDIGNIAPAMNNITRRQSYSADDYNYDRYLTRSLNQFLATDIKGIEVMRNYNNIGRYAHKYMPGASSMDWPVYIEITTWAAKGLFAKRNNSLFIYSPIPYSHPKDFYKPKYTVTGNPLADLRPTVYWQPDIITDKDGKATVSFYTKSKNATYTLILQGSNISGAVGSTRKVIAVKK